MSKYIERYLSGHHEDVWADLVALGPAVRDPEHFEGAKAVATETMRRVKRNIVVLVEALTSAGYQFCVYPDGEPLTFWTAPLMPPAPDISERIERLESVVGAIPLSIQAFWVEVGAVCLIGYHADWIEYSDPLVVEPIEASEEQASEEDSLESDPEYPLLLPVAPDDFHKDNVSGGPYYGIAVPNAAADALLRNEHHETLFVHYLRNCFRWCGFPGYETRSPLPVEIRSVVKLFEPF